MHFRTSDFPARPHDGKWIETGVLEWPDGTFGCWLNVGSTTSGLIKAYCDFPRGTLLREILLARDKARIEFKQQRMVTTTRCGLSTDVAKYLETAKLSKNERKAQTRCLGWWCAQSTTLGAPVVSRTEVARTRQEGVFVALRGTLGEMGRHRLDPERLQQLLDAEFPEPPTDRYKFNRNYNAYRGALNRVFTELDARNPSAPNPVSHVPTRSARGPQPKGQDARIIREILKHVPSKCGRPSVKPQIRLDVLAWVHITPTQLMELDMPSAFADVPDATHEEILDGIITLTMPARRKGRKNRALPPPATNPQNPYGVAALRAYAACPDAWGKFSMPSLNKVVKRAAQRAQAALAKDGVIVDLSKFSLYHLKHSLATTASLASVGLMDRSGRIRQAPGVQQALGHSSPRITRIYTQAAVDPSVRHVNRQTGLFLEVLFTEPLKGPSSLRLVANNDRD